VRSVYNTIYDRIWGEHEKRWLKEIQPRAVTEAQEANAANNGGDVAVEDGENMLEINIDLNNLEDWVEDDEGNNNNNQDAVPPRPNEDEQQAHPLNEPPLDQLPAGRAEEQPGIPAIAAAPAPDVPRQRPQQQNAQPEAIPAAAAPPAIPAERNGNLNLAISTNKLFESVLGALAFPAVSAVMGEVLRFVLPKSWTARAGWMGTARPTGLLQQKWGRSLVGGCMFVVLKDAVMLYVRWRMATDHRMRRVLDYKGKRAGSSARGR
jgi:hypothetical protein